MTGNFSELTIQIECLCARIRTDLSERFSNLSPEGGLS
jgi:hypothetical protein